MKLTAVIAEDEEPARTKLRTILSAMPNLTIVGEAADGDTARQVLTRTRPDIAFVDITMPKLDGLSVVQSLPDPPKVVFVTAHPQFAASAFTCQAADYLLKPYTADRLRAVVERIRRQLEVERVAQWFRDGRELAPHPGGDGPPRIALKVRQQLLFVPIGAIECVVAEGNYLHVLTADRKFFVRGVLSSFEDAVPPHVFFRTHRSSVVHIDHVVSLSIKDGEAATTSGYRVPVSRARAGALLDGLKSRGIPWLGTR
jgi:two-component system LytT family response regulator